MTRSRASSMILLVLLLILGGLRLSAEVSNKPGTCPVCGTPGEPLISHEELAHCECERWWRGPVVRLAVGDCSNRYCQEGSREPELRFLTLPIYRCPKDGLLFTDRTSE